MARINRHKGKVLTVLFVFVLGLPLTGRAATVGNPAEVVGAAGRFSLGVEYDGITGRDLEWKGGTIVMKSESTTITETIPAAGGSIEDFEVESSRVFLKGTFGIRPDVDLYVKLGIADADWSLTDKAPGEPDSRAEFDGDIDIAYGAGVKAKVFQASGGLRFMADAQYVRYEVEGDFKTDGKDFDEDFVDDMRATDPNATFSSTKKTKLQQWQIALYVQGTVGIFSPYGGVKYSEVKTDFSLDGSGRYLDIPYTVEIDGEGEADSNFGVFLGTDAYVIPNRLSVNVEGRFLDETAFSLGATYRF